MQTFISIIVLLALTCPASASGATTEEFHARHTAGIGEFTSGTRWKSANGAHKLRLDGRLMWDVDDWDHNDIGGLEDRESELRRARVSLRGTVNRSWNFKFQLDFGENNDKNDDSKSDQYKLKDAYVSYQGWPVQVVVGRFKTPFGLEQLSSSRHTPTVERAAFWDFVPAGRSDLNVQIGQMNKRFSWSAGVYQNDDGLVPGVDERNNEKSYSYGGRVSWLPFKNKTSLTHIALAALSHDYAGNRVRARLRTSLGVHNADPVKLVDAGNKTEDAVQWGLEGLYINGPFSLQGEYINYTIHTSKKAERDVEFQGYYLQGTWTLTGEQRGYQSGSFDELVPRGNWGAWELVARYEFGEADYTNHAQYRLWTLGLNWYANRHIKVSLNYLTGALDNGLSVDGEHSAISSRVQFVF